MVLDIVYKIGPNQKIKYLGVEKIMKIEVAHQFRLESALLHQHSFEEKFKGSEGNSIPVLGQTYYGIRRDVLRSVQRRTKTGIVLVIGQGGKMSKNLAKEISTIRITFRNKTRVCDLFITSTNQSTFREVQAYQINWKM